MKKRIVALLMALCLLMGLVPAVSAADVIASGTCGENLTWQYESVIDYAWGLEYLTLRIEGEGAMYDYELGENGRTTAPWSELGRDWIGDVGTIVVDPGMTAIGEYAFYGLCPDDINLYHSNVTEIGTYAFAHTYWLENVLLPAGLTKIEDNLFQGSSDLNMVYIPEGVTSIGNGVFSGTNVENLVIPKTVTSVGKDTFEGMPGPIWFTGDVPEFDAEAFTGYTGTVYYPADDPAWAAAAAQNTYGSHTWAPAPQHSGTCGENLTWRLDNGTLYIEGEGDMYDYAYFDGNPAPWSELTFFYLELGSGVTSIGNYAFNQCRNLLLTNLGESNVRRIGMSAFSFTNLYWETVPEGVTVLENSTFFGTYDLKNVTLPESLVTIESDAFYWSGLKELTIPSNVSYMGNNVFDYVKNAVIRFTGDAPELAKAHEEYEEIGHTFELFQGTIYYPGNNPTWTEDIVGEDSKWQTWIPYIVNPFEDVKPSDYFYEPVLWALGESITDGVTETEFAPEDTCKRSQVVTFLWRAAGEPKAASRNNPFVDVKSTDYFYEAVLWAVEKGITDGMDETHFEPDGVCNRSQVVTFLYRAFGEPPVGSASNPFTDVPANKWYATPVLWAVKEGITDGVTETSFAPENPCTRGQVVTFLYRAYVN